MAEFTYEVGIDPYQLGRHIGEQLAPETIEILIEGIFDGNKSRKDKINIYKAIKNVLENEADNNNLEFKS